MEIVLIPKCLSPNIPVTLAFEMKPFELTDSFSDGQYHSGFRCSGGDRDDGVWRDTTGLRSNRYWSQQVSRILNIGNCDEPARSSEELDVA